MLFHSVISTIAAVSHTLTFTVLDLEPYVPSNMASPTTHASQRRKGVYNLVPSTGWLCTHSQRTHHNICTVCSFRPWQRCEVCASAQEKERERPRLLGPLVSVYIIVMVSLCMLSTNCHVTGHVFQEQDRPKLRK